MEPRGVIFDMDGVIIDSGSTHLASWKQLAVENRLEITDRQFWETFGRPSREIIRLRWGADLSDEEVRRLDERKEAIYRELIRGNVPVMPGAVELMRALHADGWRLAIGSSGPPENVRLVVSELGVADLLAATTDASDVRRGKPDPEVFLLAADRMGVAPARCIVIEDAHHGIEAAHRAGMKAVALTSTHPPCQLGDADLVVSRLGDVSPEGLAELLAEG
ncbi:MAG: HAD family phosphatase [Phycisphaerae bacterium]|nr:HAD family phosphatase [Phycisphaerae bacterium]